MTFSANDFGWFADGYPDLATAFCFTLVHNLNPGDVLNRFGAAPSRPVNGIDQLTEEAYRLSSHEEGRLLLGTARIGDYTFVAEPNGYLGTDIERASRVARDTSLVSYFVNVNSVQDFLYLANEVVRLNFDPAFPAECSGAEAAALTQTLDESGFDLSGAENTTERSTPAALALIANLTDVRLTPEMFDRAVFLCGLTSGYSAP